MKRILLLAPISLAVSRFIVLVLCVFICAISCSEQQSYVYKAVKIMDKHGLFADGPAWEDARKAALDASPADMDEAHELVKAALKVAGGKHSFIMSAEKVVRDETSVAWQMPTVEIDSDANFAKIVLPQFHGNHDEGIKYARSVIDSVPDDIAGVIIDLRGNLGGNMYPMIAAVHRFISDGDNMLRFRSRKRTTWIPLSYVCSGVGVAVKPFIDCPVAILTDSLTASSAEATLLCFRGLARVRTFGCPTAGYASANTPFAMPDGSSLVLTTGCDVARTGEVFCDDPIAPDVVSLTPEADALEWVRILRE